MSYKQTTLPSGLRVASYHMPHAHSLVLGMWVDVGARYEAKAENGIAHLLEHMAFKGTDKRTAQDIAYAMDDLGAHANAYTSMEHTAYYVRMLREVMHEGADVLADIMLNSTFPNHELERERDVVLQEIAMHQDSPDDVAIDLFTKEAFPNQPLGRSILGPAEQVATYGAQHLRSYMDRYYHANNMVLVGVGAVTHEELEEVAARHFSALKKGESASYEPATLYAGQGFEKRAQEQLQLLIGWPGVICEGKEHRCAQLTAAILGGGMSSRLFQEVREKRGLAYSIYSFHHAYPDVGAFGVHTACAPERGADVLAVTQDVLRDFSGSVTQAELERVKTQFRASLKMSVESHHSLADRVGRQVLTYGRYLDMDDIMGEVDAVNLADISAMAARWNEDDAVKVALGPVNPFE